MEKAKWYIEFWTKYRNKPEPSLWDISETGYDTKEECEAAIALIIEDEKKFRQKVMDRYAEKLKEFVLDMNCEDVEPACPVFCDTTYKPKSYILDERGYIEVPDEKES